MIGASYRPTITFGLYSLFIALALSTPAFAGDMKNIKGTIIRIQPTEAPGAVAEVEMYNHPANSVLDKQTFALTLDGITVSVTFAWDKGAGGADRITVLPPEGYIAVPDVLDVPEHWTDRLLIYPDGAVGM